jgi:hypothetical protein
MSEKSRITLDSEIAVDAKRPKDVRDDSWPGGGVEHC